MIKWKKVFTDIFLCIRNLGQLLIQGTTQSSLDDGCEFSLSGLLFGAMCTSMAVAASLMGGVVQVMAVGKDI